MYSPSHPPPLPPFASSPTQQARSSCAPHVVVWMQVPEDDEPSTPPLQ
jgi:hypothetical protein